MLSYLQEPTSLDPVLPSSISSVVKCSPADDGSPCSPSVSKNVVPDFKDGSSCKRLSFDQTVSTKPRQGAVEAEAETSSPDGIVLDGSGGGSAEQSTASSCRRRSRKFADGTTWSRFRQHKATALKACSTEKVFVLYSTLNLCIVIDFI